MRIYVGNISHSMTDKDLIEEFSKFGKVKSADIITDRATGQHRGFGFVEMENAEEAQAAIEEMDGANVMGRNIKVNEAREREGGRGGFRGGRGGGGGGGRFRDRSGPSGGGGFRGGRGGDR